MKSLKEVNWSKAPDGATHYNTACSYPWLRDVPASFYVGECWVEYKSDPACWENDFSEAVKRPQEWDGEGVPPVGTVCEYRLNEYGAWYKCKVVYVLSGSDHCFVAWCDHLNMDLFLTFTSDRYKLQLQKIKTPEQIAAEERLQAINGMLDYVDSYTSLREVMGLLYDVGYRKDEPQQTQ